ncbi:unnamed protein product [Prorocentrum cordatum]|uniref:Uncharacterized protein n=1 Tax=Prorocentrum cordatum TaxID=2364126 RepID=A0ABN9WGL4_9DINO|nr:unnamed protein product [Polarella glacialis]
MGNPKKRTPAYEKKLLNNKVRRAAKREQDLGKKPAVAKLLREARAAARRSLESVLDARARRSNHRYREKYAANQQAAAAEAVANRRQEQLTEKTAALKSARAELREARAASEQTVKKLQKAQKKTEKAEKKTEEAEEALKKATAPWESWWRTLQVRMRHHLPPWAAKKVRLLAQRGPPRGPANDWG